MPKLLAFAKHNATNSQSRREQAMSEIHWVKVGGHKVAMFDSFPTPKTIRELADLPADAFPPNERYYGQNRYRVTTSWQIGAAQLLALWQSGNQRTEKGAGQ
jgi:hypothetical protein